MRHKYFTGNQAGQDVSLDINFVLETNFERNVDFKYQNKDVEYQVLIQSLEEHPVDNPVMKRKLYRRIRVSKGNTSIYDYALRHDYSACLVSISLQR